MAELNRSLTKYAYAFEDLCEAICENMAQIKNNPPGYKFRFLVRDAIINFSRIINRSVSINVIPRDYHLCHIFQQFIYILPPTPQSADDGDKKKNKDVEEEEDEEDQSEFYSYFIKRVEHNGPPLRFNRHQLCTFMHSLPRFSPDERMPGTGECSFEGQCGICLQRYFQPRNPIPIATSASALFLAIGNEEEAKEVDFLPSMDQPEAPAQLPCGHIFGEICVQRWIAHETSGNPPTCPLCRGVWIINEEGNIRHFIVNL